MAFTYSIVNSFCITFLFILYGSIRNNSKGQMENRYYCLIVLLTIGTLLSDTICWQLDGKEGYAVRGALWFFNILCYVLPGTIAMNWFFYVGLKLRRNMRFPVWLKALVSLPYLFLIVTALLTPWTTWLFSLDANNTYQRGSLFIIQMIVPFGYLLAAALRAGIQAGKERLYQQRKECLYLASFIVFPLIGGGIQLFIYGLSLAWPCTALSLMLVYVNLQNQKISLDALTGLNNRGQFDKHLYGCMEHADDHAAFVLFIMDIDEFKKINDRFGHIAGDAALVAAADILRKTFSNTNAFLARYGGDEFAVIQSITEELQVESMLRRMNAEVDQYNTVAGKPPYRLVFSIGYVLSDKNRFRNYQEMVTAADAAMYLQKQQHKAELG